MCFWLSIWTYKCTFVISKLEEFYFQTLPQKIVLMFFYDILIYNKSWEEHVQHVDKGITLLKDQQLYAKPSKCSFGIQEME